MARYECGSAAQLDDEEGACVIRIISKTTDRNMKLSVW